MKYKFLSLLALGAASAASAQVLNVTSDITSDTTWGASETDVVLEGQIFVKNDATLTILPGTIVRGQPRSTALGDPGSLIITKAGRIIADGDAENPIVFTTAAIDNGGDNIPDGDGSLLLPWTSGDTFYDADPINSPLPVLAAGSIDGSSGVDDRANVELWGGLIVLGNAPTNLGVDGNVLAGIGNIEGLPATADSEYGGPIANDDSGILRYVSVRHGGEVLGSANEINGITLGGVGYGTTVEFCEVYMNWDDGFEWFGGTVNGNNLIASFTGDDNFDGDQGWIGQVQFALAVMAYNGVGSSGGDEAFEFDGDDAPDLNEDLDGNPAPLANYTFANFTIVGGTGSTGYVAADTDPNLGRITLRNGYSGQLYNGYIVNPKANVFSISTGNPVVLDTITVKSGATLGTIPGNVTQSNIVTNGAGLIGEDAGAVGGLNPRPIASGFPLPAGITSSLVLGDQFETVSYVGAFDTSTARTLWTTGWTAMSASGILVD
ncbi:MAG: hypothetical protein GVY36_09545 [Verrucomicrobia bacterium]|jgi:hypothetical protein|nr:hypothetical protein [Verrucomicrobiota bacterium]